MTIAVVVFWRTAYPTISWWDSAQYSLAAGTLGIVGAPGSLLLTLLGWPIAHLPIGSSPAHLLNCFAGVLAALVALLVYLIALGLRRITQPANGLNRGWDAPVVIGAAIGALTFAFATTLWEYAVQFTPYVLSAVFTALILWTMLRWWESADYTDSWRWLALLGLLFGLDFSVHRTNALLLPAALAWVLVRRPRTLRSLRDVFAGGAGAVVGLAVQLLDIPIARGAMTRSPLFWNDPTDWQRFWDYVSIKQLGGGFLIQFFPRKSDFWSVQVADLLHVLGANFLHWSGRAGLLGVLPAAGVLVGLATLWRRKRRLAVALALVLFLQAAMTVLYFNIPANFFRTFDRHYLPVCVTLAVVMAYGVGSSIEAAAHLWQERIPVVSATFGMLAALALVSQVTENWSLRDASKRYFTKAFALNELTALPRDAILFTAGDNDTFPLLYFQAVEGIRQDVAVINMSVANLPAFPEELRRRDPEFPLTLSAAERDSLSWKAPSPQPFAIPVMGDPALLGLAPGAELPNAITATVRPQYGTEMMPADVVLLDIARTNRWQRPLCFAITATRQAMAWLDRYGRLDGLYWRVVPMADPPVDTPLLRANLLERADYGGYADSTIQLEDVSKTLGIQSYVAVAGLLEAEQKAGDFRRCQEDAATIFARLPPARLGLPASYVDKLRSQCVTPPPDR
jgi:hypothetical protein